MIDFMAIVHMTEAELLANIADSHAAG